MADSGLTPARLSQILRPWRSHGLPLYQRIARHLDLGERAALLVVGCGDGQGVQWLARRTGAHCEGVDADPSAIARADASARAAGVIPWPTYQAASPADLPYEAAVFDAVIVDLVALGADAEPAALSEAARVARDRAPVLCLAPVWVGEPPARLEEQAAGLGLKPRYVMEWKQILREAKVVDLAVEEAGTNSEWLETSLLLTLFRGWKAAAWRGLRAALGQSIRAVRAAAAARTLQLSLIRGSRWPRED